MSDDTISFDPDGVGPAAEGLRGKGDEFARLASQFPDLMASVRQAAGDDALGRQFSDQVVPQIGQLQQGVQSLAGAFRQTGDSVHSMATMFDVTERDAADAAGSLGQMLNADPGSGGDGPGSGGDGPGSPGPGGPDVVPASPAGVAGQAAAPGGGSGEGPGAGLSAAGAGPGPGAAQPRDVVSRVPAGGSRDFVSGSGGGGPGPGGTGAAGPGQVAPRVPAPGPAGGNPGAGPGSGGSSGHSAGSSGAAPAPGGGVRHPGREEPPAPGSAGGGPGSAGSGSGRGVRRPGSARGPR